MSMTGTPEQGGQRRDEPWASGPVEDTGGMPPILPDAGLRGPVEDTPGWTPAPGEPQPTSGQSPSNAYPASSSLPAAGATTPSITGFFSSVRRSGRWELPETLTVVQGFSDAVLDLREAIVRSRTVDLKIYGGFAETKIIVPPGVGVDLSGGVALFSDEKSTLGVVDPAAYRLRVSHFGAFSSVRVITLAVGEEPKKWWKKLT